MLKLSRDKQDRIYTEANFGGGKLITCKNNLKNCSSKQETEGQT